MIGLHWQESLMDVGDGVEKRRMSRLRAGLTCRDNREPGAQISVHNLGKDTGHPPPPKAVRAVAPNFV